MNKLLDDESDLSNSNDRNIFENTEYNHEEDIYLCDGLSQHEASSKKNSPFNNFPNEVVHILVI